MISFRTIPSDLLWFAKRYNALLVEFPKEITLEILKKDSVCSRYDPEDAYAALKSAHGFLTAIASELFLISAQTDKKSYIEKIFLKIDLLWGLVFKGQLQEEGAEYTLYFDKINLLHDTRRTLPKSYPAAFDAILENGCYVEYFKGEKEVKNYRTCSHGRLHFENSLTALGLYLFIKKCSQKRWYWTKDQGGGYTKRQFTPILDCAEPYYRVDMRVFICGERLFFDIMEELSGYSNELKRCFKKIYDFVRENYSDCLPANGFWGHTNCSITFGVDTNHRMIGQIGVGLSEKRLGIYAAMSGKEMEALLTNIDSFEEVVVKQFLHEFECDCDLCRNKIGVIVYRGKRYNRVYKNTENRFSIENESDADQAIKCIDIKAKCNMNTRAK